jgi:hypothetical protein
VMYKDALHENEFVQLQNSYKFRRGVWNIQKTVKIVVWKPTNNLFWTRNERINFPEKKINFLRYSVFTFSLFVCFAVYMSLFCACQCISSAIWILGSIPYGGGKFLT